MVIDVVGEIEREVGFATGLKGVSVLAGSRRGRQFRGDVMPVQVDAVVARLCVLAVVAEWAAELRATALAVGQVRASDGRHQQQIAEVAVSGAAEGGVGKPEDGGVAVLVASTVSVGLRIVSAPGC